MNYLVHGKLDKIVLRRRRLSRKTVIIGISFTKLYAYVRCEAKVKSGQCFRQRAGEGNFRVARNKPSDIKVGPREGKKSHVIAKFCVYYYCAVAYKLASEQVGSIFKSVSSCLSNSLRAIAVLL